MTSYDGARPGCDARREFSGRSRRCSQLPFRVRRMIAVYLVLAHELVVLLENGFTSPSIKFQQHDRTKANLIEIDHVQLLAGNTVEEATLLINEDDL